MITDAYTQSCVNGVTERVIYVGIGNMIMTFALIAIRIDILSSHSVSSKKPLNLTGQGR